MVRLAVLDLIVDKLWCVHLFDDEFDLSFMKKNC